jgi:hypothetical protein
MSIRTSLLPLVLRTLAASATTTALAALALAACGDDGGTSSEMLGGSLTVSGDVYDFQTNAVISGAATVTTSGLVPAPTISVTGSSFVIDGVLEYSAFQIYASAPPTHRLTYNAGVEVTNSDLSGVKAFTVSEAFMSTLASGFQVTPSAAKGVLLMQLVDSAGNPKAGVAASNIVLAGVTGASAPKFLDANLAPAGTAMTSSASGIAVIFEIPPGVVSLGTAVNATQTLQMATSPVGAGAVTIARVVVTDGAPPMLPTNVSFANQVFPIFTARGCVGCHSGNGPGRDLGGLKLDGGANVVYRELVEEDPTRVVTATPETSLVLTMPSAESPPDGHPNVTFTGPQDPDYQKILVWIREGAKNN